MATLSPDAIAGLLQPFLPPPPSRVPENLCAQLSLYLDLLVRWNERMNLTAIRDPAEIVVRHFGESLFLGSLLPEGSSTLLDLGSGAGFPGLPLQLLYPMLTVTLVEAQSKKAAFLREVVRCLNLPTAVRQEHLVAAAAQDRFGVVALRAVDRIEVALAAAVSLGERLLLLTTVRDVGRHGLVPERMEMIPGSRDRVAVLCVPRGTS